MEEKASPDSPVHPALSLDRVRRRREDLFLEGHLLSADEERHEFFGHLGLDFFILNVPFTPEGRKVAELFITRLGEASRGPETKCGGGCSGDGAVSGLVTVFAWVFPPADEERVRKNISAILSPGPEELI